MASMYPEKYVFLVHEIIYREEYKIQNLKHQTCYLPSPIIQYEASRSSKCNAKQLFIWALQEMLSYIER